MVTPGESGVLITIKDIYDAVTATSKQVAEINGKMNVIPVMEQNYKLIEERLRKVEIAVKAIPPAFILVLVTIVLAYLNQK